MIPALSLHNLICWSAQVALIVGVGLMVPRMFRIRTPRPHLWYCHGLLVLSLALPFIPFGQKSDHATTPLASSADAGTPAAPNRSIERWSAITVLVISAGIVIRLSLFLAGLLQIRRYKRQAIPYGFPKDSILAASRVAHPHLFVGISASEIGPVTMGWWHPTVLLPSSFLSLPEQAQHAILSHELQHITRSDWLSTLIEEFLGACFWFHPALWWLLERIKITREQVIDSDIVRHSFSRDAYIDALLGMAAITPDCGVHAAPAFIRSCHLSERLHLLLGDWQTSRRRTAVSYSVAAALVIIVASGALVSFPLIAHATEGSAGIVVDRDSSAQLQVYAPGEGSTAPRLIERIVPEYSDAARLAHVQGTVVLEGVVGTDGTMTVKRVVRHLHPQLDRNAVAAVNRWRFEPLTTNGTPIPATLFVEVTFSLPR
jgi:TonB family protein